MGDVLEGCERYSVNGDAGISRTIERRAVVAGESIAGECGQDFAGGKGLLVFASRTAARSKAGRCVTREKVTLRFLHISLARFAFIMLRVRWLKCDFETVREFAGWLSGHADVQAVGLRREGQWRGRSQQRNRSNLLFPELSFR